MKKIISFALVIACVVTLFACGGDDKGKDLEPFTTAISATSPTKTTVKVKDTSALGDLNGTYTVTYESDTKATIEYEYEQFNSFAETEATGNKKKVITGTVTYDNGKYSDNGALVDAESAITGISVNLNADKMTYTIDGNTLTGSVKAENVKDVLGIDKESDVQFIITTNGTTVTALTITYGNSTITCAYN